MDMDEKKYEIYALQQTILQRDKEIEGLKEQIVEFKLKVVALEKDLEYSEVLKMVKDLKRKVAPPS